MNVLFRIAGALVAVVVALIVAAWIWERVSDVRAARALEGLSQDASRRPRYVEATGTMPRELVESSGVAVSRQYEGVLWTHNDSGDDAIVYAIDFQGRLLHTFEIGQAEAYDWEDMSLGPCLDGPSKQLHCLYIGDTGDNERRRSSYTIYIVPEPATVTLSDIHRESRIVDTQRITYVYPDDRYDSEALAVRSNGDIILVTKGRTSEIEVFTIARNDVERSAVQGDTITATFVTKLPFSPSWMTGRLVTGAAFSPSGSLLVIRTYFELFFFEYTDGELELQDGPCFLDNIDPQGEAVDFVDERTLVLTSESIQSERGQIHLVRCR